MQQLSIAVLTAALLQFGPSAARAADLPQPPRPGAASAAPPRPMIAVQSGNAGKKLGDEMECLLEPHLVANVGSPVEGTLNQVLADRGSAVGKGQVVARLNSSVEAANLELRMAQEEFGKSTGSSTPPAEPSAFVSNLPTPATRSRPASNAGRAFRPDERARPRRGGGKGRALARPAAGRAARRLRKILQDERRAAARQPLPGRHPGRADGGAEAVCHLRRTRDARRFSVASAE